MIKGLLDHQLCAERAEGQTGRPVAGSKKYTFRAWNGSQQRQMVGGIGAQADANFMDSGVAQAGGEAQGFVQHFLDSLNG